MKLTCSKDILYNARREALTSLKTNEVKSLLEELNLGNNWYHNVISDLNDTFCGLYCVYLPVAKQIYASDVCFVDDTSCTNKFHFPISAMVVEDENGKSQLLSFAFLESRLKQDFENYFRIVRKCMNQNIRVFVCDRNEAQTQALTTVWPDAKIIHCSVHIARYLKTVDKEIHQTFVKMIKHEVKEEEFLAHCYNFLNSDPDKKKKVKKQFKIFWIAKKHGYQVSLLNIDIAIITHQIVLKVFLVT